MLIAGAAIGIHRGDVSDSLFVKLFFFLRKSNSIVNLRKLQCAIDGCDMNTVGQLGNCCSDHPLPILLPGKMLD